MRPLTVIFRQPALCEFPCFIQGSEQIKIQDFCPVCPIEPFDKAFFLEFITEKPIIHKYNGFSVMNTDAIPININQGEV